MAKIELRDCNIYMQDGLAGTGAVDETTPTAGMTSLGVDATVLNNTDAGNSVPVGARFTIASETGSPVHTVTAVTPTSGLTTDITFTPALAAGVADNAVITYLPQRLTVKIGDGNLTYTEARELTYELDRDNLDTVREGAQQPLAINLNFMYEHVRTGTAEKITPVDALKGIGGAASWISASDDKCEPYAVDLIIDHTPACSGQSVESELTTFEDFRWDQLQYDFSAATISTQGRCNRTEAVIERE